MSLTNHASCFNRDHPKPESVQLFLERRKARSEHGSDSEMIATAGSSYHLGVEEGPGWGWYF